MKAALTSLLLAATLTAQTTPSPISGKWHLISASGDEINIPLLNLKLTNNSLTLQMAAAAPILTMTAKGDIFEGHWMKGKEEVGPMMKLVRFR